MPSNACKLFLVLLLLAFGIEAAALPKVHRLPRGQFYQLRELAADWGLDYKAHKKKLDDYKLVLSNQRVELAFDTWDRMATLNGTKVYLHAPVILHQKRAYVSKQDVDNTFLPILRPQRVGHPKPKSHLIILDPGHGGKDHGCSNRRMDTKEKVLTLAIALRTKHILESAGYSVLLTREQDNYVELSQRARFANQKNAGVLVSIHINAASSEAAHGVETFAMAPPQMPSTGENKVDQYGRKRHAGNRFDPWNSLLAYSVQSSILKQTHAQDRGIKRKRMKILREAQAPGILVECGFITNPREAKSLASPNYQDLIARGIAKGIARYFRALGT